MLAAAYAAAVAEPPPGAFVPQQRSQGAQPPRRPQQHQTGEDYDEAMEGELPSIDDLEVAAAAAGVAPVPAVLAEMGYFELGQQPEAVNEDSSSEDESEESSSSEEGACGGTF